VKAYDVRRTPRTQEIALLRRQQAPGFSWQNCSNLPAGELGDGEVVVVPPVVGLAPPVWGGAAPPCGVLGLACVVVVGAGVVVVAVDVEVSVVVVGVVDVLSTFGVFASPGTVSLGVVGSGSAALLLLPPPPQAAKNGTSAIRQTAATARILMS
jgi:hypothetical protein